MVLTVESVDETIDSDRSNECYQVAFLLCCLSCRGRNPKHGQLKSVIEMKDIAVTSRDAVSYPK